MTAADRDYAWNLCQSNKRAKLDIAAAVCLDHLVLIIWFYT